MANRRTFQFRYSFEQKPTEVFAKVTIGASGAPTLVAANSKGVKSIVRNGAGDYTITLQDNYPALLMMKHVINSGSSAPASPGMYIKADTSSAATPAINFIMNAAGTATDPASGEIVYLQMVFRNSQF